MRVSHRFAFSFGSLGLFHQLHFPADSNFIAYQHAAGFQGSIPVQAEVFAVNLRGKTETCFFVAPRVFSKTAEFYVEGNFLADAPDGQLTGQAIVFLIETGESIPKSYFKSSSCAIDEDLK